MFGYKNVSNLSILQLCSRWIMLILLKIDGNTFINIEKRLKIQSKGSISHRIMFKVETQQTQNFEFVVVKFGFGLDFGL